MSFFRFFKVLVSLLWVGGSYAEVVEDPDLAELLELTGLSPPSPKNQITIKNDKGKLPLSKKKLTRLKDTSVVYEGPNTTSKDISTTSDNSNISSTSRRRSSAIPPEWNFLAHKLKDLTKAKCSRLKSSGITPQSHDSPLKVFGYPLYDEKTKKHSVFPGVTLTIANGFRIPIKVGVRDYILQGPLETIMVFLHCFSEYLVIGSVLKEDGHWSDELQSTFPLHLQVENTGADPFGLISLLLMRRAALKVLEAASPLDMLLESVKPFVMNSKSLGNFLKEQLTDANKWYWVQECAGLAKLLGVKAKDAVVLWFELKNIKDVKERRRKFFNLMKKSYNQKLNDDNNESKNGSNFWVGRNFVNLKKTITLIFTMFPRQANNIRATFVFDKSTVSLRDVLKAMYTLMKKEGAFYAASQEE